MRWENALEMDVANRKNVITITANYIITSASVVVIIAITIISSIDIITSIISVITIITSTVNNFIVIIITASAIIVIAITSTVSAVPLRHESKVFLLGKRKL